MSVQEYELIHKDKKMKTAFEYRRQCMERYAPEAEFWA